MGAHLALEESPVRPVASEHHAPLRTAQFRGCGAALMAGGAAAGA
jgi:hypothetical protein